MKNRNVLQPWTKDQVKDEYEGTGGTLGAYIHNQFNKGIRDRCHVQADSTTMALPVG